MIKIKIIRIIMIITLPFVPFSFSDFANTRWFRAARSRTDPHEVGAKDIYNKLWKLKRKQVFWKFQKGFAAFKWKGVSYLHFAYSNE